MYGKLTTELDAGEVVELDKLQYEARVKEIFEKLPWLEKVGITKADCLKEINIIAHRIINDLPQKLQVPKKEIEDDQTVEVEREVKTETQRETQLEVQEDNAERDYSISVATSIHLQDCDTLEEAVKLIAKSLTGGQRGKGVSLHWVNAIPVLPLKSYLESDPLYNTYASIFDGIRISINILEFSNSVKEDFKLLGSHRMDFHHLLVKDSKVTLLTQNEAMHYYNEPDYYNLTLGFLDLKKKPKADELFKIVKIKFLNGESHYSTEEITLLRIWIKGAGVEKMQKLFVEMILNGYPKKAARYQNSPLQQIFDS